METKTTTLSAEKFLTNLKTLKYKMRNPLPSDVVYYKCEDCSLKHPLNSNGILELENCLEHHIDTAINQILNYSVKTHSREETKCSGKLQLNADGTPENVIISFPASDKAYIRDFYICDDKYKAILTVVQEYSVDKAICVLYQKETIDSKTYFDFFDCNYTTFLDVDKHDEDSFLEEEVIHDDESVSLYQHEMQRMTGGGRSLSSKYQYECRWCPTEILKFGHKGKFRELRSYRQHFLTFHHQREGVPMTEFDETVKRADPKWACRVCGNLYSLGNSLRHKAACWPKNTEDKGGIESEEEDDSHASSDEERSPRKMGKILGRRIAGTNESVASPSMQSVDISQIQQNVEEPTAGPSNHDSHTVKHAHQRRSKEINSERQDEPLSKMLGKFIDNSQQSPSRKKRLSLNASLSNSDDDADDVGKSKTNNKKKVKIVTRDFPLIEIEDEFCSIPSPQSSPEGTQVEPKAEPSEELEIEIEIPSLNKKIVDCPKWWLKIQKHLYVDKGLNGPQIFLHGDSEEFVKRCTERYRNHMLEKKVLDEKMVQSECAEAKLLQFSDERDKPILDKYIEFVKSSSAKDVLKMFSEDYQQLDQQKEVKSSTSKQYSNRIIEFFKFMASLYHNFHLDWMLDFKSAIEKTDKDGTSFEYIFVPRKEDLTQFIRKYKYGSNPAANCGIRIFALKKLLDYLSQEIKDNEHAFTGNLLEKRSTVDSLVQRIQNLNSGICPDGTIKHLATASNKSHKRSLLEQMAKCPERSLESVMQGVTDYVNSEEYVYQKTLLIELAYKKTKVPTSNEYMNSTNWLLEQLVCIGGNRPCALLGITLKDWEERKPGYCPFFSGEGNEMVKDDPGSDNRTVLKDPFRKPDGAKDNCPTGVIVSSETDKIAVGQPCYIWFPNELVDLVNDHSLLAQKCLPMSVDLYHPKSRLFLNSQGNPISRIKCDHFKTFIGLPITAYDFRRSLSTFCLDSKDESIRNAEASVLRHREETGFAYYYQKHSERVEYVNIQYALKQGLLKAGIESVDKYCAELRTTAKADEFDLAQKRAEQSLEYEQQVLKKRKEGLFQSRQKGGRNWILPKEYEAFMEGIEEAVRMEDERKKNGRKSGPFSNLLNYKPGAEGAGIFPTTDIWQIDMYRVLYGLGGEKGEAMRAAELTVYDGVPFSEGLSGRRKIAKVLESAKKRTPDEIVADYWREKIKAEARQRFNGKWLPLRFVFTGKECEYNNEMSKKSIKKET